MEEATARLIRERNEARAEVQRVAARENSIIGQYADRLHEAHERRQAAESQLAVLRKGLEEIAAAIPEPSRGSDKPDSFVVPLDYMDLGTVRAVGRALGWPVVEARPGKHRGHMGWIDVPDPSLAQSGEAGRAGGWRPPVDQPTYETALALVRHFGKPSTSFVQRKLQVGYNLARGWIERMEAEGVCTAANSAGARALLSPAPEGEENQRLSAAQSFSGSDAQERCHEAPSSGGGCSG